MLLDLWERMSNFRCYSYLWSLKEGQVELFMASNLKSRKTILIIPKDQITICFNCGCSVISEPQSSLCVCLCLCNYYYILFFCLCDLLLLLFLV